MFLIKLALRRITSKWLILLIEQGLTILSLFLTLFTYELVTLTQFTPLDILFNLLLTLTAGLCGTLMFNTHRDIIRYSDIKDIFRVLLAVGVSYGIWNLALFSAGSSLFAHPIPHSMLLMHAAISAVLLISFRVLVRELYFKVIKKIDHTHRILIFGAGQEGISAKKAIEMDNRHQYQLVGFLDQDLDKIGKKIGGITIHSGDLTTIGRLINELKVRTLIITTDQLDPHLKLKLSDLCEEKKVSLKITPPLNQWSEGVFRTNQLRDVTIEMLLERPVIQVLNDRTRQEMRNKVVLVTGGAGSIGSEICRQLSLYPVSRIIALDQSETGLFELANEMMKLGIKADFTPILASVRDGQRIMQIMQEFRPDMVFHAAAYKHVPLLQEFPMEVIKTNVMGTMQVLNAAAANGVSKFVMVSTDKAVNPTNLMGASKRMAEMLVQQFNCTNMQCITTRFGNVLGSNGSVVPIFKKQIEAGGPVTVTHHDITRYFMTIPEASMLVIEAATMGKGNEIFVFDMGEPVKILDLAKKMIRLSGLVPHRDIEIAIQGLRPGEKMYEELFQDSEYLTKTHHPKIMRAKASIEPEIMERLLGMIQDTEKGIELEQADWQSLFEQIVYKELAPVKKVS
jgi:FlaA1/EpsC-like NDP-sugar epimerase